MQETKHNEKKWQAIVMAAKTLFSQTGYSNTSMDAIAKQAGVSKQTIYSYFGSKEALFTGIMDHMCTEIECPIESGCLPSIESASAEKTLLTVAHAIFTIMTNAEVLAVYRIAMSEASQNPKLATLLHEHGPKRMHESLAELFAELKKHHKLDVKNTNISAPEFLSLILGQLHQQFLLGIHPLPTEKQVDAHIKNAVANFIKLHQ